MDEYIVHRITMPLGKDLDENGLGDVCVYGIDEQVLGVWQKLPEKLNKIMKSLYALQTYYPQGYIYSDESESTLIGYYFSPREEEVAMAPKLDDATKEITSCQQEEEAATLRTMSKNRKKKTCTKF